MVYISCMTIVTWVTFVIRYILVSFKSWCRAPQGRHDPKTCRSNIRLYLYMSEVHLLMSRMKNLTLKDTSVIWFCLFYQRIFLELFKFTACMCCGTVAWIIPQKVQYMTVDRQKGCLCKPLLEMFFLELYHWLLNGLVWNIFLRVQDTWKGFLH